MSKVFLSNWTILSLTLIALPGWTTNSNLLIGSHQNLAQLPRYSKMLARSISINPIQKLRQMARMRLQNNLILTGSKANKNAVVQQKFTPRFSPQRGAFRPKPDRD